MEIDYAKYTDIDRYSVLEGINQDVLVRAYLLEERYHNLLLNEPNDKKRVQLYDEFYSELIPLYGRNEVEYSEHNPKDKYVKLFAPELSGKSIIDYGCGQGHMLVSISNLLQVKSLTGIDVSIPTSLKSHEQINSIESNIMTHQFDQPFDIALSDNVLEHLVPSDAFKHLQNISNNLRSDGQLIIIMPNRLFGPWDITRIKDFSQTGKTAAQGGHVNESTHKEMIDLLSKAGFKEFKSIIPIPKLKYLLFNRIRINARWLVRIESSNLILKFLRAIQYKGEAILRFPVVLIAKK